MSFVAFGLGHHSLTGQEETPVVFGLGLVPSFVDGNDLIIETNFGVWQIRLDTISKFELNAIYSINGTVKD